MCGLLVCCYCYDFARCVVACVVLFWLFTFFCLLCCYWYFGLIAVFACLFVCVLIAFDVLCLDILLRFVVSCGFGLIVVCLLLIVFVWFDCCAASLFLFLALIFALVCC